MMTLKIKRLLVRKSRISLGNEKGIERPDIFFKLDDAIKHVEDNTLDIYEGSYKYVVIESMKEGFYPIPEHMKNEDQEEIWFEWKGSWDKGEYKRIEKPECTKSVCNWGLG